MGHRSAHVVVAAAAAAALLAVGAAPVSAEQGRLADFTARLTSTTPGAPTGLSVHLLFHRPDDPDAKPSPLRSAVVALPPGWRADTGALPECTASDDELRALGSNACPADSELTVGSFSAILGFGPPLDPFHGDNHVFNGPGQLIEVITNQGGSASPGFDRLMINGSTVTAHPPMAPGGPPDGEAAVRSIDYQVPVRTAGGRSLFTTPPDCPAGGRWMSRGTFGFADGTTDSVSSTTPCQAGGAAAGTPALRLAVRPRRVRAVHRVRFVLRVRSGAAHCIAGARVRFAGRSVRTDIGGRAVLTATLHRPGRRRASATRAGCRAARAYVHVTRPRPALAR